MDVIDAIRRVARAYPGGIDALAPRLATLQPGRMSERHKGKSPDTLRHELSRAPNYKLGTEDLEEITLLAQAANVPNALEAVHALNSNVGLVAYPLPRLLAESGSMTLQQLAQVATEFGDLVREVSARSADGDISSNDLKVIDKELGELLTALHTMRASLGKQHAEQGGGAQE